MVPTSWSISSHSAMRLATGLPSGVVCVDAREVEKPMAPAFSASRTAARSWWRGQGFSRKLPERCMLVLNHISWLDIFVIDATFPATFIAKSEIRRWPVVGWLCSLVGTLYIERGKRSAARHARETVTRELERGVLIAVFPEGTTTYGRSLERFHAALFQPALDAAATLQPAALRYLDGRGQHTDAAGYVGETSLLGSAWAIVSTRRMVVELKLLEPISAGAHTRRSLADQAEAAIAAELGVPASGAGSR